MCLRDPHVKEPLREFLRKLRESRSVRHCRRQRNELLVLLRKFTDLLRKDIGITREFFFLKRLSGLDIERLHTVESRRIFLRRLVTFSLFRDHMDQDCMLDPLCFLKHADHRFHIMSVNRSKVGDPHILKQHSRDEKLLDPVL